MAVSLLDLFRVLSSLSPARTSLKDAPWDDYVDWAIAQGLAPLAAYNLEYRMPLSGAPEWARDRLMSVYQGSVNDNVMKLVSFKRTIDDLEGRKLLVLGGSSFADVLYPHVAFRPVSEIKVRVDAADVEPFAGFLREAGFKPLKELEGSEGAARVLSDDHTALLIYADLLGPRRAAAEQAMLARALPIRVYGPSAFRPDLEDAILLQILEQARAGFDVPMITFVDLRELVTGASAISGPYSRPVDAAAVKARAAEWRIERAVHASLSIVARMFPETASVVAPMLPDLRGATRAMLGTAIVEPISALQRVRVRGVDRMRRLLVGG